MSTSDDKGSKPAPSGDTAPAASPAADGETGAVKPIVRRRVAKSAATAERPAFQEAPQEAPQGAAEASGTSEAGSAIDFALPRAVSTPEGAPSAASGGDGAPASGPRPDSRGTGRSADGRWDMRAPPRAGGRPGGFHGAPGGEGGGMRRPGASGGRAMPFIPQRDAEGRPVEDRPRYRTDPVGDGTGGDRPAGDRPAGDRPAGDRPAGDRPDRGPRPPRGPRPERRFDGPRPPRTDAPRGDGPPRGDAPRGDGPPRGDRPRRDDHRPPRGDGAPREARGERPAARGERLPHREIPPPPPAKKVPTVAETILLGLPKAKLDAQNAKDAQKPKTAKEALRAKTLGSSAGAAKAKPAAPSEPPVAVDLQSSWIAAGADGAVDAIKAAGAGGDKLVEAWVKAQNAGALAEIEARDDVSGAIRKAAKRGVFALRAKGVAIPERRVALAPKATEDAWEATFLPPDGRGSMAFTISKKLSDGRLQVAEVIAREPQGVVQAASAWLSRTQLREGHQRASARAGIAPVAVPVAWARLRIAQALKLNRASGTLLPLGLDRCRELIEPAPESVDHPIASLEATLAADAPAAAASLHNEPEFRGWLPDERAVSEMLRALGEALGEGGAKDPEKVSKGLDEEVKNATDRYFSPEVRSVVAGRLRDAALSIRARAGEDRAKEVVATARAIESAGLITSPPRDVAFLSAFFQKAVATLLQQGRGSLRIPVAQAPAAG